MVPCLCNFLHQSIVIQSNSIWYSLAYLGTNVQKVHSRVLKWLTKTLYCNIYLGLYIFSSTHFNSVYCAPPFPSLKPLPMTTLLLKSVIFHATLKLYQVSMCPLLLEFHCMNPYITYF